MSTALLTCLHCAQGAMGCHQKATVDRGMDSQVVRMLSRYCNPGKGIQASGKVGTLAALKAIHTKHMECRRKEGQGVDATVLHWGGAYKTIVEDRRRVRQ